MPSDSNSAALGTGFLSGALPANGSVSAANSTFPVAKTSAPNPLGFKTDGSDSAITLSNLSISPEPAKKVRIYFKTVAVGIATINIQVITKTTINKSLVFQHRCRTRDESRDESLHEPRTRPGLFIQNHGRLRPNTDHQRPG